MKTNTLWLFINPYGWVIIVMSVITAFLVQAWWVALFGVIGYQVVLLVELTWGGAMGRTGRVRLARAEQENRELRDEKSRLSGTIDELMKKAATAELPAGDPSPAGDLRSAADRAPAGAQTQSGEQEMPGDPTSSGEPDPLIN